MAKMRKANITVYDYQLTFNDADAVKKYEVEANCVGGDEGVFATFEHESLPDGCIGYATGDDGHWVMQGEIDKNWVPGMIAAFKAIIGE